MHSLLHVSALLECHNQGVLIWVNIKINVSVYLVEHSSARKIFQADVPEINPCLFTMWLEKKVNLVVSIC